MGHAWEAGVNTLDTAIGYGESEQRLGEIGVAGWRVVTKLPPVPETCTDVSEWVDRSVTASMARLGVSSLEGLLLHRPQQLLEPHGNALYAALLALKKRGMVDKIGVSVYGMEELDALCPRFEFGLVQAPMNVVDRRLASSGWLATLRAAGTEVHVRSVFLQGLLLMAPENRPRAFAQWNILWSRWDRWLDERQLTPLAACLGFVLSHAAVDRVIVGADTIAQIREILAHSDTDIGDFPENLISQDLDLIIPTRWKTA